MAFSLAPRSRRDVWLHAGSILVLLIVLVLGFFYIYLPYTTHHGQTVTVPQLTGMNAAELESFLDARNLEYLVDDSTYNPDKPSLTVLSQYPAAGQVVKTGRKIFVTLNSLQPPLVKMPSLLNRSVTNAEGELESYGLRKGNITYVPDIQHNAVLKQLYLGKEIKDGALIPKGSKIDLEVGDGLGNQEFEAPNLVGTSYEEAGFTLSGVDLRLGTIIYQTQATETAGTVVRQQPTAGAKIRVGEQVDLWIAGPGPGQGQGSESGAENTEADGDVLPDTE
jgi:eukaryotic-like serine/threonine-protein kinase